MHVKWEIIIRRGPLNSNRDKVLNKIDLMPNFVMTRDVED